MTHHLSTLLLLLVTPVAAHAQTHRLTTGVLPVGAQVVEVTTLDMAMQAVLGDTMTMLKTSFSGRDSSLWRIVQSRHPRVLEIEATQLGGANLMRRQVAGEPPEEQRSITGSKPKGAKTQLVREDLQWIYHWSTESSRGEAHDAAWENRRARPGESWHLAADTLERMFGPLADTSFFRVTLDSVGDYEGGPVAFLSYAYDVTTTAGEETRRRQEAGTVARRIDLGLNTRVQYDATDASMHARPTGDSYRTHITMHIDVRRVAVGSR